MEDRVTLFMSADGFTELEDVLNRGVTRRKFPLLTSEAARTLVRGIRSKAQLVADVPAVFRLPRDPADEHILNLAISARVAYLVTRDKDLSDLMGPANPEGMVLRRHCPGLVILDPVAFLRKLPPAEGGDVRLGEAANLEGSTSPA